MISLRALPLADATETVIVLPVNAGGVFRGPFVKHFRTMYPDLEETYKSSIAYGELRVGNPLLRHSLAGGWFLFFPTRQNFTDLPDIHAIEDGLHYLHLHMAGWLLDSYAFPKLGCELNQLKWSNVYPLMQQYLEFPEIPVRVYLK